MRANEFITEDVLNEGIKDTLKKIGLGALLSISLSSPVQALDNLKMSDLLAMGMSQEQAVEINKMPSATKSEIVHRYEKMSDDPSTSQVINKLSTTTSQAEKDKEEIKKPVSYPVVDKDTGYYKTVDPAYIKNPFGDLLKGSGWESAPSGEMAKLKVLGAKTISGNPNLMAVFTTSVWGVKQFTGGKYKGLYVRSEPEQIWGVKIYDKNTGAEYNVNRDYKESDANSVKKFFDSGNFNIGKNIDAGNIKYGLNLATGPGGFQAPYFNQAKDLLK